MLTAAAGGTVVASPFLIAALSSASIVSILATLGGGAISVGGLGVAGGVGALILSCASVSTLSAFASARLIRDPEVEKLILALRDLHAMVEKSKRVSATHLERMRQLDAAAKKRNQSQGSIHPIGCRLAPSRKKRGINGSDFL